MLMLICIGVSETSAQKNLSGNFTQPNAHVNTIGSNWVKVDNITGFEAGDTVLLIQMQGIEIVTIDDPTFGTPWAMLGEPGMHEFIIINAVNAPDEIVFQKNIRSTFNKDGKIQLVRVPYYNSAVVTGKLTCDAWNPVTGKGGVLALIIGRSLKLDADIDVTGLGFRGAVDAAGVGRCSEEVPLTKAKSYPDGFLNAGLKGEGMAIHNDVGGLLFPTDVKGEGPSFTGGGGGNGRYSGGGGGSNYGYGGIGGNEDCYPGMPGGYGGIGLVSYPTLADRIRLGGGGGASTSLSGLSGAGGNGGGIVIIIADTIFSSGGKIIADGAKGGDAILAGGAGGGGGGGTIALYTNNYGSETLTLSASGGDGGNNAQSFGEGGGGGGGLIYVSTATSANVISMLNGGVSSSSLEVDIDRMVGIKQTGFKAILNGFLYNSIRSSVSGNQVDSVCSNMVPPKIQGTKPMGGTLPYTYKWEKYDGTVWSTLPNDADPTNYTPLATESGTVLYRRTITDSSLPDALVDVSMPVQMIVQPFIKNNTIGTDAIICYAQNPVALASTGVLADGNGKYSFKWEASTDNVSYSIPANINNTESYTPPPALLLDSWYRRTVISGRCVNKSASVYINVLDTISNNRIINLPPEICNGMTFDNLLGTTPATTTALAGGDDAFRFRWEANINGAGWLNAPGTINMSDYNPTELAEKIPSNEYYFRRVVLSGAGDVCTSVSNTVLLKDFPVITNNTISSPQVICSGTMPVKLTGPKPDNGNGFFTYAWQDSSKAHSWMVIPDSISKDYQPPALTDTTSYRRMAYSSACFDISKSVRLNVHKPIINNNISVISSGTDTTIWKGRIPHKLIGAVPAGGTGIPGTYTFYWEQSTDGGTNWAVATGISNLKDYSPPSSLDVAGTLKFRRRVTSGTCSDISNTINITVLPPISNNTIPANLAICYNTVPPALTGTIPAGGTGSYTYLWQEYPASGTMWTVASGTNIAESYSPPALSEPTRYRRIVTSGTGDLSNDTSGIADIAIYALPTGKITNTADTTICENSKVELKLELTGEPPWDVTYRENAAGFTVKILTSKIINVLPASASALDTYNYSLFKIEDANGCLATSLTGTKKASVYKNPKAEAGPDQIICGPAVTLSAIPTVGTGAWTLPQGAAASAINSPSAIVTIDTMKFVNGKLINTYLWEETNWLCKSKDSVNITFYKRINHINAGPDTIIYSLYKRIDLSSDNPEKWETASWTTMAGSGDFVDRDGDTFSDEITGLSVGLNTFELKITNGKCFVTDLMSIENRQLEIPEGFSPNNDPEGFNNTFVIKGLDLPNQIVIFKVFNGAGLEVFSSSNLNGNDGWIDWDGKNSRGIELPEGTYYYLLTIAPKENSGGTDLFKGFIILKRY